MCSAVTHKMLFEKFTETSFMNSALYRRRLCKGFGFAQSVYKVRLRRLLIQSNFHEKKKLVDYNFQNCL